jgi:hypothetical protein
MKQVRIRELDESLNEYKEYTSDEINDILSQLKIKAHKMGYKNITFTFESTMERHEDCLGSPILTTLGWIPKDKKDLKAEAAQKKQEDLAQELGCTYYEAGLYLMLKSKGIV